MNFDAVPPAAPSADDAQFVIIFPYKYTELWMRRREVGHR